MSKALLLTFVLVVISSCANQPLSKKTSQLWEFHRSRVCHQAEGKGRISRFEQRNLFRFEYLMNFSKNFWGIGLNIPMVGEELLRVNWDEKGDVLEGSLGRRVISEFISHPSYSNFAHGWFAEIKKVMMILESDSLPRDIDCRFQNGAQICLKDTLELNMNRDSFSISSISKLAAVAAELKFQGLNGEGYKRISFSMKKLGHSGPGSRPLIIDLFLSTCSK